MASGPHSFLNFATFLDIDALNEIDRVHGSSAHDVLDKIHTYQTEYDPYKASARLPQCFVRDLGDLIDSYVILRDPNHNDFTYVNPRLLNISIATRWGTDVKYPLHDPPIKHMLPRSGGMSNPRSSRSFTTYGRPVLPQSFVCSYLKKLSAYDAQSGTLVLPWYGFGESAFQFTFTELVLVDHYNRRYPCRCSIEFSVDSQGELACKLSGG